MSQYVKMRGHKDQVFAHKSPVETDGNIHVQSDAEVADYSIKTLPEETDVETVLAFSSDGTLAGMLMCYKVIHKN